MAAAEMPTNGPPGAPAVVVERAGDHLLARPRLPAQQHAHVAGRDAPDRLVDLLHRGMAPDERAELPHLLEPGPERADLLGEPLGGEGALGEEQRLVEIEGLGQVVVGALLHRLDRRLHRAVRGHDDDLRVGAKLA